MMTSKIVVVKQLTLRELLCHIHGERVRKIYCASVDPECSRFIRNCIPRNTSPRAITRFVGGVRCVNIDHKGLRERVADYNTAMRRINEDNLALQLSQD